MARILSVAVEITIGLVTTPYTALRSHICLQSSSPMFRYGSLSQDATAVTSINILEAGDVSSHSERSRGHGTHIVNPHRTCMQ